MYSLGIDISHYNQSINWSQIKNPVLVGSDSYSIGTVIIKASEGLFADPLCVEHATNAHIQGLQIGYYCFCHPYTLPTIVGSAQAQAQVFANSIKVAPNDIPLALDLEVNVGLSPSDYLTWVNAFIAELQELTGVTSVLIYGSPSFLNTNLPHDHQLGKYPLWLAQYCYENQISIPIGWTDFYMWQFSGGTHIPQILGNVDLSFIKAPLTT